MSRTSSLIVLLLMGVGISTQVGAGRRDRQAARTAPANSPAAQPCPPTQPQRPLTDTEPRTCPQWFFGEFDGVLYYEAAYYTNCPSTYFEPTFLTGPHECPCACNDIGPLQCQFDTTIPPVETPLTIPADGDIAKLTRTEPKWKNNEQLLGEKTVRFDHDGLPQTPDRVIRTYVFAVDPRFGAPGPDGRRKQGTLVAVGLEIAGGNPAGLDPASLPEKLTEQKYRMTVGPVRYAVLLQPPAAAK